MEREFLEELKGILKLPNFDEIKSVLCVQPHPDDADVAVGATIAKLTDSGVKVTYITVTDGSLGTQKKGMTREKLRDIRRKEQEEAAKVLGVHDLIWLDFLDGGDYTVEEVRKEVISYIRKLKPDLVLTVDPFLPYEAHPDHRKCGLASSEAVLFYRFPLIEDVEPESLDFQVQGIAYFFTSSPNLLYCVDGYMERKFEAIAKHKSQFDEVSLKMLRWYFERKSRILGEKIGCEFAEPFKVLNAGMIHSFPEACEV